MIVFIYDTETTGLTEEARVVQHAIVAYDVKLKRSVDSRTWLCWETGFNVAETKPIHGWEADSLRTYGTFPALALMAMEDFRRMYNPVAVIAHNAEFDMRMLRQEVRRTVHWAEQAYPLLTLPWLCTKAHADYGRCPSKDLLTVAAFHGFVNPMAHDAIFDCFTLARVIQLRSEKECFVAELARRACAEKAIVFANLPPKFFDLKVNEELKKLKFKWQECEGYFYEKSWIKVILKSEFEELEKKTAQFGVTSNIIRYIYAGDQYKDLSKLLEDTNAS